MSKTTTKKQDKSQFFRIHVRPDKSKFSAIQGVVDPIREVIVGNSYEVKLNPPNQIIPNWYEALVLKSYNDKTNAYEGKFEWYDEKKHQGRNPEKIIVRYLSSTLSLDAKWQDEKGFKPSNEQEEVGWEFPSGEITDIPRKEITDKFIEFLEHHELNGDNPNRDTSSLVGFYIVDASKSLSEKDTRISEMEEMINTMKLIRDNDDFALVFASCIGVKEGLSVQDKKDIILSEMDGNYNEVYQKYTNYIDAVHEKLTKLSVAKKLVRENGVITLNGKSILSRFKVEENFLVKNDIMDLYKVNYDFKKELDNELKSIK